MISSEEKGNDAEYLPFRSPLLPLTVVRTMRMRGSKMAVVNQMRMMLSYCSLLQLANAECDDQMGGAAVGGGYLVDSCCCYCWKRSVAS